MVRRLGMRVASRVARIVSPANPLVFEEEVRTVCTPHARSHPHAQLNKPFCRESWRFLPPPPGTHTTQLSPSHAQAAESSCPSLGQQDADNDDDYFGDATSAHRSSKLPPPILQKAAAAITTALP